ncbi:retrovirus-related pol polyprotein from transposon TNT 1-94 [Tanacetum coccineum]
MQREEDLRIDDLKHYEAEIEAINLILISILNDIYNSYVTQVRLAKRLTMDSYDDLFDYLQQFKKLVNGSRAKKLEKLHDPLALVQWIKNKAKTVVDYDDDYQGDTVQNNSDDPLTSTMILLARAITRNFSNPTNNRLHTSSNTRNQAIVQGDRVKTQSKKSGTVANVQCYNCSEKGHYARNYLKPKVRDSKYFMEQMLLAKQDEAGVILTDEQNDFLFADASRMEEIKELSANICLMARIQQTNIDSEAEPSYNSAFPSEVQTPSTSYVNPLFARDNQEHQYLKQPKIINNIISDDQIDTNIIFDAPNAINNGSVEEDNNVQQSYELEQLARNAYRKVEKQQIIAKRENCNNGPYIIQDLEQQRDKLDLNVVELKRQTLELQKTQSILKRKMSENEDQYHDTVLNLKAKVKKNVDTILKIGNSLPGMFMLGPKPMSFYDSKLKHGLGSILDKRTGKCQNRISKLFDSIKKTCAQTQREINELIENVKQKTYAYADVHAQNQDLLMTISELKAKLKNVENDKSVNTKFDKANVSKKLL